jgi:hypothetical protein
MHSPTIPPMKTKTASLSLSGNRGSAFITVLLFTFMLTTIIASMLQWSLSERRLNMRNSYWLEARNGAEALAEYGASQLDTQFKSQASPPTFNPTGTNALALPATSFFSGSLIDSAAYTSSHTTGLQLVAGDAVLIPAAANALYYIDGNDPNNRQDPMKNQWVYRRDVQIVASATVIPPNGGKPVTARVSQTVMVRGAPLFSHAIFYSANDLEIFPGPVMNIYGPVHCNGNIFMSSQGTNSLTFNGPVSMTGNIYHAWSNSNTAAEGTGSEALKEGAVNFLVSATTSGGTTTYTTATMNPFQLGPGLAGQHLERHVEPGLQPCRAQHGLVLRQLHDQRRLRQERPRRPGAPTCRPPPWASAAIIPSPSSRRSTRPATCPTRMC